MQAWTEAAVPEDPQEEGREVETETGKCREKWCLSKRRYSTVCTAVM